LVGFTRNDSPAYLKPAGDGLGGEGGQYDMTAIREDYGLGPSAAGHVDDLAVGFAFVDGAFGWSGIGGGYRYGPAHGQYITKTYMDQFNAHFPPLNLLSERPKFMYLTNKILMFIISQAFSASSGAVTDGLQLKAFV
jgi:hypothetical protein